VGSPPKRLHGSSAKTVLTDHEALRIEVPREREGSFEPQLIGKHERRLNGFDDKIIKTRGYFPSDDAGTKLVWLTLRNITTVPRLGAYGLTRFAWPFSPE